MTFAAVGSGYSIDANASTVTFSPNPVSVGDLFVATVVVENNTAYATGITGSNITWVQAGVKFLGTTTAFYAVTFLGTATATGAATNTVAFSGTPNAIRGFAQEFSSTAGSWALDGAQGNVDADTANCPSLTPAKSGDLYWCFARNATGGSGGSTSGYTFFDDSSGNWGCYNPACTSAAQAPVFGTVDTIVGMAILVKETLPSAVPAMAVRPVAAKLPLPGGRGRVYSNPGSTPPVFLQNSFENQAAGNISTGNSSSGGTAWDVVDVTGTGALTYDTAESDAAGLASGKFANGSPAGNAYVNWSKKLGNQSQLWFRMYCYFQAYSGGNLPVLALLTSSGTVGTLRFTNAGKAVTLNTASSTITTSTLTLPVNQWFRVEGFFNTGTGRVQVKLFTSDPYGTIPDETDTGTSVFNASFSQARFGNPSSVATDTFWLDDVAVSNTGYIGPVNPRFISAPDPVRAVSSLSPPPRGRIRSNPGGPVVNPPPVFIQATAPVRARIPQASPRGRVYSTPAPPPPKPPAPALPYLALRAPVRARVSLPAAGRISSNRGGPVRNPASGPVFRQFTYPARSHVPATFSKGRIYSNPGSPPAHLPTPGTPPFNIRVWPGNPGPYYSLYGSGTYTLGTQFSVSVNCTLQNIWWFSPPYATSLPSVCGLWDADTQSAITEDADPQWLDPDGNIALPGDGWVYCNFSAAQVSVVPGVHYVVSVYQFGTNWWVTVPGYWTAGSGLPGQNGITNAPLTAPNTGNSVNGQGCYDTSGTWAFPGTNPGNGEVFYADAELSLLPATGQVNPVRARLPLPRRGICQTFRPPPAAPPHPQPGPVFRQATTPVRTRITLPPRGRVISDRGAPVPPPPVVAPFRPATFSRARLPLPRRGICRTTSFYPLSGSPGPGPVFQQASAPARIRVTLPPRGRTGSNPGGPVLNPPPAITGLFNIVFPCARLTGTVAFKLPALKVHLTGQHTGIPNGPLHVVLPRLKTAITATILHQSLNLILPKPATSLAASNFNGKFRITLPALKVHLAGGRHHNGSFSIVFNICSGSMMLAAPEKVRALPEAPHFYGDDDGNTPCFCAGTPFTAWSASSPQVQWITGA